MNLQVRLHHIIISAIIVAVLLAFSSTFIWAQTTTPSPTAGSSSDQVNKLQDQIKDLENKISDTQKQQKTLSSQITVMDSQIKLTQLRIAATEEQIKELSDDIVTTEKKINGLEESLGELTKVLLNRISVTYKIGSAQPIQLLLSSGSATDLFTRANYLKLVQAHDKKLIYQTEQAKNDYANQKAIFEDKKKKVETLKVQLVTYTDQIKQEEAGKQKLLSETKGSEANYQKLLNQAKAQLAGFTSFATAAGGGAISFGSGSNGWYYTQRDPQWGGMLLPGSSSSVLLAGCAVTSVAMVCKSYGQGVTPASIAGNSENFIGGDLWNWAFSCGGKTTNWIGVSQSQVKSYVDAGTPIILRLVAPSVSGLHFVVAWKSSGNDFIIHDPYYGPDKNFSERYNWSQVTSAIAIH